MHSIALSVRAIHSFFCRSADLHQLDGPQGETNFARVGGASSNRASFTQRVMVSCSAHRGRGGALNCLVGASDSLIFLPLGRSPPARRFDGPQGETNFACVEGASSNRASFTQRVMVSCSAHRGRGGALNCLVGASDSLIFLPLGRSPPARRSAGRDEFRTRRGRVAKSR